MDAPSSLWHELAGVALGVFVVLIALSIYFFPTSTAVRKQHGNLAAIFVLNLFLGWTFIGWVGALVWAYTKSGAVVANPTLDPSVAHAPPPAVLLLGSDRTVASSWPPKTSSWREPISGWNLVVAVALMSGLLWAILHWTSLKSGPASASENSGEVPAVTAAATAAINVPAPRNIRPIKDASPPAPLRLREDQPATLTGTYKTDVFDNCCENGQEKKQPYGEVRLGRSIVLYDPPPNANAEDEYPIAAVELGGLTAVQRSSIGDGASISVTCSSLYEGNTGHYALQAYCKDARVTLVVVPDPGLVKRAVEGARAKTVQTAPAGSGGGIRATDLQDEYRANPLAADAKYEGHSVVVSGVVASSGANDSGLGHMRVIMLSGATSVILCFTESCSIVRRPTVSDAAFNGIQKGATLVARCNVEPVQYDSSHPDMFGISLSRCALM